MTDASLNERVYDQLMSDGRRSLADEFAAANGGDDSKVPILIYAFHAEGYGGFDWAPDTHENRTLLAQAMSRDVAFANYTTGTLVTLFLAPHGDRDTVTDFIEGELQDAIEVGAVGHIIGRFNLSPIDDSPCLALGRHYMWQRHRRSECSAENGEQDQ